MKYFEIRAFLSSLVDLRLMSHQQFWKTSKCAYTTRDHAVIYTPIHDVI
jgi:hypothetical protein